LLELLRGWNYEAPGTRTPTGEQVEQSAATALFNLSMVYLIRRTLGDELGEIGWFSGGTFDGPYGNQLLPRALIFLLERTDEAATYDESIGDSWVFDDMSTTGTTETRLTPLVMSVLDARDRLASEEPLATHFGREIPSPNSGDPEDWVWGKMHGLRLSGIFPSEGSSSYARPAEGLPFYERPGGEFAVSPCNHGYDDTDFTCTSGSSLRMIHQMNADGESVTYNAIPGGYSGVPGSETYLSEMQRWQNANPRKIETDRDVLEQNVRNVRSFGE
jgi:penicillin amidase